MTGDLCGIDGCDRVYHAVGLCHMHYKRRRKHGDPTVLLRVVSAVRRVACEVEGCGNPHKAHGFCAVHHGRWKRTGDPLGVGPLPPTEVVRLRRMVGLPDDGPTAEMREAWNSVEGVAA